MEQSETFDSADRRSSDEVECTFNFSFSRFFWLFSSLLTVFPFLALQSLEIPGESELRTPKSLKKSRKFQAETVTANPKANPKANQKMNSLSGQKNLWTKIV